MVLSADDMGIREDLDPIYCSVCGNRIGWEEDTGCDMKILFCETCAKKKDS